MPIIKRVFYGIYKSVIMKIRQSKLLFKIMFGYFPKDKAYDNYWDWTSLILVKVLKKYSGLKLNLLDMGTGPYGVLSYYSFKKLNYQSITGSDKIPELIHNSKQQMHQTTIKFIVSDLFENLPEKYDLIIFNTPYIDEDTGNNLEIFKTDLQRKRWSGGNTGTEIIKRFLSQLKEHLRIKGIGVIGVNRFYISDNKIKVILKAYHYKILKIHYNSLSQACAYEIQAIVESEEK